MSGYLRVRFICDNDLDPPDNPLSLEQDPTPSANCNDNDSNSELSESAVFEAARFILLAFSAVKTRDATEELILPVFIKGDFRDALHNAAPDYGLYCDSKMIGALSIDYIAKPNVKECLTGILKLSKTSELAIRTLLERYPLISEDVVPNRFRRTPLMIESSDRPVRSNWPECNDNSSICKLATCSFPKVPPLNTASPFKLHRESLPIWKHRKQILGAIQGNQVVLIKGDAGCGKTTQIPQFIMDNAVEKNEPVRIVISMPKKVAVIAISERVAAERGERVGGTVGYQVKLESRVSPCDTLLTYCTSGVFLRSISNLDYTLLKTTTHLIIDEVHVRDRFTDFIIAFIEELLPYFPKVRLIIIGADDHLDMFALYFGGKCCQLDIPGFRFEVRTKFLDDVLLYTNFQKCVDKHYNIKPKGYASMRDLENVGDGVQETCGKSDVDNEVIDFENGNSDDVFFPEQDKLQLERSNADKLIDKAFAARDNKPFEEFVDLVVNSSEISVNYTNTKTGITILMAAAAAGSLDQVRKLLRCGSDPCLIARNGYSAKDFSRHFEHPAVYEYLISLEDNTQHNCRDNGARILSNYLRDIEDEREHIDLRLIVSLIHRIHCTHIPEEGILVFLPGYEEIVTLKHMIFGDTEYQFRDNSIVLYLVHSNMQNGDQRSMFSKPRDGVRKILLATNIVENSLTFDDVVHVIDSGKKRDKICHSTTDATSSRSKYSRISKSSALQRKGRVGRCQTGYHYCLYSAKQFDMMDTLGQPELLWCSLQQLCLQCKEMSRSVVKIRDFFQRLPDPPPMSAVDCAVHTLISLGALDDNEELTSLGTHLIDFAIEPRLGKALLYAVVLKCIDPVLTIVSTLAFRDPFVIPDNLYDRKKSFESKKFFSHETFSDHVAILKAFQEWEKLKGSDAETAEESSRFFCSQNYISSATFEMIYGIRTRLLAQLRASGFVRCKGACDVRELNRHSDNWAVVKAALLAALFPNIAKVDRQTLTIRTRFEKDIRLDQSSTLLEPHHLCDSSIPSEWLIYDELTKRENISYIRGCTAISGPILAMFGGTARLAPDVEHITHETFATRLRFFPTETCLTEQVMLRINSWIAFIGSKTEVQLLLQLRVKFHSLIERQMRKPGVPFSTCEESVLSTILLMVTAEDQRLGLIQTDGIGQWPKFAGGNLLSAPRFGFEKTERPDRTTEGGMTRNF